MNMLLKQVLRWFANDPVSLPPAPDVDSFTITVYPQQQPAGFPMLRFYVRAEPDGVYIDCGGFCKPFPYVDIPRLITALQHAQAKADLFWPNRRQK